MTNQGNGATPDQDSRGPCGPDFQTLVGDIIRTIPAVDIHTHLFAPEFGEMNLFGIDNLLTYHYLVAEMFRAAPISPDAYWAMKRSEQADLVWQKLFVESTPVSEAARGVITVLSSFGLDPEARSLDEARDFFASVRPDRHVDRVLEMACVDSIVMTNDPFDPEEMSFWNSTVSFDPRFRASLRMDRLLNAWGPTKTFLSEAGYSEDTGLSGIPVAGVRRYLDKCIKKMAPLYLAVSLPDDFQYPAGDIRDMLINDVVFPTSREHGLPFCLMIGVRRGVNPALRSAGDGVGRADVSAVERLCLDNPDVRFLVTMLSRENQHELCVAARKFANLMPFGCWWFLNNPSIVKEITTERLELLGTNFIPQHSDARVLEQLIYKWKHSRTLIAECLADSYTQLARAGRTVSGETVTRDLTQMFSGNFSRWTQIDESDHAIDGNGRLDHPEFTASTTISNELD